MKYQSKYLAGKCEIRTDVDELCREPFPCARHHLDGMTRLDERIANLVQDCLTHDNDELFFSSSARIELTILSRERRSRIG